MIIRLLKRLKPLAIVQGLLAAGLVHAQQETSFWDDWQFHGFAAQSYIHTDDNQFFGDSEHGSFEFWELGVNTLWRPHKQWQFAAQLVARDAGKTDDGDFRFDYALIDYNFGFAAQNNGGLRIGRIMNPFAFYNDTRDVAATRPGILLPQSIYFDVNRNLALSSDGAQFYYDIARGNHDFSFQFGVFEPRTEDPDFETAIFFQEVPGELEGTKSWMGRLLYEHDLGRIRLAFTAADVNVEYDPGSNDPIPPGEFNFTPYILSAQYNGERWSLTAEVARRTTELSKFGPALKAKFTGTSYFIQGAYRFLPNWEAFLRYDELIWNNDDRDGREFEALSGMPHHSRFAKDWTIGLRWDVTASFMLCTEWHHVNGTGWLSRLENPDPAATEQYWNLFAFTAAYRF